LQCSRIHVSAAQTGEGLRRSRNAGEVQATAAKHQSATSVADALRTALFLAASPPAARIARYGNAGRM
jgi:hypothetical protein